MELTELAAVFSTWKGHCYIFRGTLDGNDEVFKQVNRKIYAVLNTKDFICRMVNIKGTIYVYSEKDHIVSTDFDYLGEINGENTTQGAE